MPYLSYKCETCEKHVTTHRSKKRIDSGEIPKYCSYKCRPSSKKFQWKKATKDQIIKHLEFEFEKYVIRSDGCWGWKGSFDKDGYAILGVRNIKYRRAHRVSWFLKYGNLPDGLAAHTCDNRWCSKPLHIFITDNKGNIRDSKIKGRLKRFAKERLKNGQYYTKLTKTQVLDIKNRLNCGEKGYKLAEKYKVSTTVISNIKNDKSWKHVP